MMFLIRKVNTGLPTDGPISSFVTLETNITSRKSIMN